MFGILVATSLTYVQVEKSIKNVIYFCTYIRLIYYTFRTSNFGYKNLHELKLDRRTRGNKLIGLF